MTYYLLVNDPLLHLTLLVISSFLKHSIPSSLATSCCTRHNALVKLHEYTHMPACAYTHTHAHTHTYLQAFALVELHHYPITMEGSSTIQSSPPVSSPHPPRASSPHACLRLTSTYLSRLLSDLSSPETPSQHPFPNKAGLGAPPGAYIPLLYFSHSIIILFP